MHSDMLIEPSQLEIESDLVIIDCRFNLADPAQGHRLYLESHIPSAHYLHLNDDLSSAVGKHGGRHPLPDPVVLASRLAQCGIGPETEVVAYDDSRFAFASRLWWLMRSLGYRPPRLLNGGYRAWLAGGGESESGAVQGVAGVAGTGAQYSACCDIEGLRAAQQEGATLVDSREERRYQGLEEPIDPVAGHIPGALNHPWQGVTDDSGRALDAQGLRQHWGTTLDARELVVYCGSGVTACVNLFSLALLGRDDAVLYAGSWSDWCSYLQQ
jgi:thiosulfate/3-mercaptopyruvate sulfurtransferase